ncbi:PilN domain-containing protein [Actinoplanes bogorensis]|uniref:PilN domain-containing protein n=1 Tax=Paractinoplanes bogorensis TaxID=1610840 RepID=A0ABS5Z4K3_9ACTN|nr:PilN domain-containing protein [Actinoplanes bogorensis]MBU2670486.1 PilN domain-containing protein [Actinoplanes bogorensis]
MTTTQTTLMPVDPAVSPAQASRVLTIRVNLLPDEIKAGRSARRTRGALIVAVVVVVAVMAGWYFLAFQALSTAQTNLDNATGQVQQAQAQKARYNNVTKTIANRDAVAGDIKTLMVDDLPWATYTDAIRSNATAAGVSVGQISTASVPDTGTTAAGAARTVATVTLTGNAPDKPHIAAFLDKLAAMKGFSDPYLTTASKNDKIWNYALTIKVTSDALCGRFTEACPATGGK